MVIGTDIAVWGDLDAKLETLATDMAAWDVHPRIDAAEETQIKNALQFFRHTTEAENLIVAGVDGTGDFPALSYADSFVYLTIAQGTCYQNDAAHGLRELDAVPTLVEFTWLALDDAQKDQHLDASFEALSGSPINDLIDASDYRELKAGTSGRTCPVSTLADKLIRPKASDTGNIQIQLRSTGELGAALRLIKSDPTPSYVLMDSTFSLPFVSRHDISLYFEHVKRMCCVEALSRAVGFFALSKSHGLPAVPLIERFAADKLGLPEGTKAEHWYLRIPDPTADGWSLSILEGRNVPPPGAKSYLARFHKNTPVMRLDMDIKYWEKIIKRESDAETVANEQKLFGCLDYAGHDQRAYGYPYPIKAGHDRASLPYAVRERLRKKIIDTAVSKGMRPGLFTNVSMATGHE